MTDFIIETIINSALVSAVLAIWIVIFALLFILMTITININRFRKRLSANPQDPAADREAAHEPYAGNPYLRRRRRYRSDSCPDWESEFPSGRYPVGPEFDD